MEARFKARTVAVHPDNNLVLVGFYDGSCEAFSLSEDYKITSIKKWKPCKKWISAITFAPNKTVFALGSHDNSIYIYEINNNNFVRKRILRKHSSFITHLDFSMDSQYLHSTCGAYELLFWDVGTG